MDRKLVVLANGSNVLKWLYDWCHEKLVSDPYRRFSPGTFLEDFLGDERMLTMFKDEAGKKLPEHLATTLSHIDDTSLRNLIAENTTLIGEFSDLLISEQSLKIRANAQYSLQFASGSPLVFQEHAQVLLFQVHRVGKHRSQVQVTCDVPEIEWVIDDLWQDMGSTFEVIGQQKAELTNSEEPSIESPKEKGHYRLTKEDIKFRRHQVKMAIQIRKKDPKKQWKEIAAELEIPERTLRDWRHNPEYS